MVKDPIDIERLLVWTFMEQKAHLAMGYMRDSPDDYLPTSSGCATIPWRARLGTAVDCASSASAGFSVDPDAEEVFWRCQRLHAGTFTLIKTLAITASRPTWGEGEPLLVAEPELVMQKRGDKWDWYPRERKAGRTGARWCVVQYRDRTRYVASLQHFYLIWHDALCELAADLRDLKRWEVTGPAVPKTPWVEKSTQEKLPTNEHRID